jgi:hypothetical protein
MSKPATLVRICPFTQTVHTVEWSGEFKQLTTLLDPPDGKANGLVEFAPLDVVELCVDEEGGYMDWPAFSFLGAPQTYNGRALVFSSDRRDGFIPALDVETVTRMVTWNAAPTTPRFEIITGADALARLGW